MADKQTDDDDKEYIETILEDIQQESLFSGWVTIYTVNCPTAKERLLLVSNFRVMTIKCGLFGKRSIRQNYSILDLSKVMIEKDSSAEVRIVFTSEPLRVQTPEINKLTQSIMFASLAVVFGQPDNLHPRFEIPDAILAGFRPPAPDKQDGLLARYMGMCNYCNIPQRPAVLDTLISCFENKDHELDISQCLTYVDKPCAMDIQALASAMRYSDWFEELAAIKYPLGDDGVGALSTVFSYNKYIHTFAIVDVKATRAAFISLAQQLRKGQHGLEHLFICRNSLNDSGMQALADALSRSTLPLQTLCLQTCKFGSKGFRALRNLLCDPEWTVRLQCLDVSENHAGRHGSSALASFLEVTTGLCELTAVRCDLDCEVVLKAIQKNKKLSENNLNFINFSGNRITKQAAATLTEILEHSQNLGHMCLAYSHLPRESVYDILRTAMKQTRLKFFIDVSGNDLGVTGVKLLASLFEHQKVTNFDTLILNDNAFGDEGMVILCEALCGDNDIRCLALDCNVKTGLFSSSKAAGEALGTLLTGQHVLEQLSVAGDDAHYWKSNLVPLLAALADNKSLKRLDISGNRIGDEGFRILAQALSSNNTLISLNIDNNRISLTSLQHILARLQDNHSVTDLPMPIADMARLASAKNKADLKTIIHQLGQVLERNRERVTDGGGPIEAQNVSAIGRYTQRQHCKRFNTTDIEQYVDDLQADDSTTAILLADAQDVPMVKVSSPKERSKGVSVVDARRFSAPTVVDPPKHLVSGQKSVYHSYSVLKAGSEFPDGIDITKRETYLSPDDFKNLFGMPRTDFIRLPKFRQLQRKRQLALD